jgi:hypothetical protein
MGTRKAVDGAGVVDEDTVLDELYGRTPDEFTAARDERARQAREAGDRDAAARIGALRRPVLAAWLANLLVRAHREEIDAFLELGAAMRSAQANLHGPELRELSGRRRRVIDALQRQARALAAEHGHPGIGEDALRDLQDTLAAALADPDAASALAGGRLSRPLHPGAEIAPAAASATTTHRRPTNKTPEAEAAGPEAKRRTRARNHHEAELASARTAITEAEHTARRSHETARARHQDLDAARARYHDAAARAEDLKHQLAQARTETKHLNQAMRAAQRDHEHADQAAHDADQAVDTARSHLAHIEHPDADSPP